MERIVRLTESDLARIVRRVINEEGEGPIGMPNPSTQGAQQAELRKGPLVGTLVVANKQGPVEFGQTIEFKIPETISNTSYCNSCFLSHTLVLTKAYLSIQVIIDFLKDIIIIFTAIK